MRLCIALTRFLFFFFRSGGLASFSGYQITNIGNNPNLGGVVSYPSTSINEVDDAIVIPSSRTYYGGNRWRRYY